MSPPPSPTPGAAGWVPGASPKREERHDRDMAALARKGYRLDLCRRVIEAQDVFAAEELARSKD